MVKNILIAALVTLAASHMSWRPLLEGDLAARAEDAVRAISEDLVAPPYPFVGGKAGVALFHGYVGQAERAEQLMDQAVDALATTPMRPALYGGYTGIAWAAEHLSRVFGEAEPDDMSEEIDESLLTTLAAPWTGNYDLIGGLAGFGVYALERVPRPSAVRCLESIVDRLHETAEIFEEGVTWFTSPELLPPRNREEHPRGYYNLGVAHGVRAAGRCRALGPGFLAGAAGIGLALLAGLTSVEPEWDRLLMLS